MLARAFRKECNTGQMKCIHLRYFHNEMQPVLLNSQLTNSSWIIGSSEFVSHGYILNEAHNTGNSVEQKMTLFQKSLKTWKKETAQWTVSTELERNWTDCSYPAEPFELYYHTKINVPLLAWGRIEFAPECLVSRAFSVKQDLSNWIMLHCADVCLSCFILFSFFRRFSEYASSE